MSVSAQEPISYHVGNGVTVTFAYDCKVLQAGDLHVYVDDALVTTGFTVSGIGSPTGGSVTFDVAPANLVNVRLERDITLERLTDYQQNGDFLSRVVNPDFDRIWMALQQRRANDRDALLFPRSENGGPYILPVVAARANSLLGFDAIGNPVAVVPNEQSAAALQLLLSDAIDQSKGAALVGRATVAVASIPALMLARKATDLIYIVRGYQAGTNFGGGMFYWDPARDKATHDGGSVINPAAPYPADWTNAVQIAAWYAPTAGTGCWVRLNPDYYPDEYGANYAIGVDQTPMIQQTENRAVVANKPLRLRELYHELRTQLAIRRAPQIVGDSGGVGSLRSGSLVAGRKLSGAVFVSRVVGTHAVKVLPPTFDFGGQIENLTLLGRYNTGEAKVAGSGVSLDQFGWSAVVDSLTSEDFLDTGVEIGYLQDTTFTRLTVLGCGNTYAKAAVVFNKNANFLYFRDAHIEDGNYLLRAYASDANGGAWEIHWSGAHFEVGNYTGTPDLTLEHRYATPCARFEGQFRQWRFGECTFVPVGSSYLSAANGGGIDVQPYFLQTDDAAGFKFTKCSFLSPTTGIDPLNMASTAVWANAFGPNELEGCTFRGLNQTSINSPVKVDIGNINGGVMHFYTGVASTTINAIRMAVGRISGVTFVSTGDVAKTGGRLINGVVTGGVTVGENEYKLSTPPFIWINKECNLSDCRSLAITDIPATTALNMELEKPGTTYQISGAVITVTDITNCQRGRRVRFFNSSGTNATISQTPSVYPNAAVALVLPHLTAVELVSDAAGVLMKV